MATEPALKLLLGNHNLPNEWAPTLVVSPARNAPTWALVDMDTFETYIKYGLESSGRELMAVVMANAYWHFIVAVSEVGTRAGASLLAVEQVGKAVELGEAGIGARFLLIGQTPPGRAGTVDEGIAPRTRLEGCSITISPK